MLLSLITNMAAVTSPANQQLPIDLSRIPVNKASTRGLRWTKYSQLSLRRTPLGPALSVCLREVSVL